MSRTPKDIGIGGAALKLKPAILSVLGRDDLKGIIDDLGMDGVDRRSVDAMRAALRRARRATPEVLLGHLRKGDIQSVCELLGVPAKGKKDELIGRLISEGPGRRRKRAVFTTYAWSTGLSID